MRYFTIIISLLMLLPSFSIAQKGKGRQRALEKQRYETNLEYYNEVFSQNEKEFKVTEAPEKWKSEPVVILCQKTHISLLRLPGTEGSQTKGVVRKRILIQDKAALEEFSEFYYQEALAFGLKHIKADGTVNDVDIKNAVKVETDIPRFYADSYQSDDYYKIAVPDLEVGDILDYFKVFEKNYGTNIELISPISYTYPVVSQEIIFDIDKFWNFFYGSFNGAPSFKQDPEGGVDAKGRKRKIVKRFILKDTDRPAQKEERWTYTYLTEPLFKVMILPPNAMLGNKKLRDQVKENLSVKASFGPSIMYGESISKSSPIMGAVNKRLRSLGIKKMSKEDKVNTIYNTLRYEFLVQSMAYAAMQYGMNNVARATDNYLSMKSEVFAAMYATILEKNDIPCELVVVVPRYFGTLEDVVLEQEMEFGVYIPFNKKYYWTVDNYRSAEDNYAKVTAAAGYKSTKGELRKRDASFKKITTPTSKADENVSRTNLEVSINSDNSLAIKGAKIFTGLNKEYYSSLILAQVSYIEEDLEYLRSEKEKAKLARRGNRTLFKSIMEKYEKQAEELKREKKKSIENWLKDDFEFEDLNSFEVVSFGRFPEDNELQLDMDFSSKGYLQKAGPNLILEVGKLITGQVELEEDEIKERTKPIEQSYARTFENNITIMLPEGYTAQGLDNLVMNVENESGAFISEARQEGNSLFIKATKIYKKESMPKEEWNKLVEMLEAAYTFSQKKIILKK